MKWPPKKSESQQLFHPLFEEKGVTVFMLRDDLLHPGISGNKWRKLKYNLLGIANSSLRHSKATIPTIVTVGGSHSNHIAAVAEAGKVFGFETIGLIRGYESYRDNATLKKAAALGMDIGFFDKEAFNRIETDYLPKLKQELDFEFIPMGGGNILGMKGCVEINEDIEPRTTHILTACGTGSTFAGIVAGARSNQQVIGFPAMKNGAFMTTDVNQYLNDFGTEIKHNFRINTDYHFGGFAKLKPELVDFINQFKRDHGIALDGIYNGKMMFGLFDLLKKDYFPKGSIITSIHTGGVQGNLGLMNKKGVVLPLS